jgi:hypothetical protein
VTRDWRHQHFEEIHDLCCSITSIKQDQIGRECGTQGETGNSGRALLRKHEKDRFGRPRPDNEIILKLV